MINAAMHGFASFRVRHIFDELVEMQPDAILIYSGNNEFLEKRSYFAIEILDRLANNMATVRWLRSQVVLLKTELPADKLQDVALFFWKKVKRQALELREDSKQFEKVQSHYRYTMEYMVSKAKEKEIPILLGTVAVNLRDWLPTVSHNALKGSSLKQWEQLYNLSRKHLLEARYIEGIKLMNRAIELEPEHAESHFWLARMLEAQGCFLEARQSYSRSRDLDYNPFRAISAFNNTLRSIARKSEGVTLVDLEKVFEEHSGTGTPGFNLFLDYVHPNTTGNTLIAKEVFRVMTAGAAFVQKEREYDDALDLGIQTMLFTYYAVNHQYEAAIAKVRHLFRLREGREPISSDTFASMPPKIREGYMAFERYEEAQKKSLLGELKDPAEKDAAKRMLQAYYEKWFSYDRF